MDPRRDERIDDAFHGPNENGGDGGGDALDSV